MSVLIIAEAGVNHNGDMQIAKQLIDVAAAAGADLVKFQTFRADTLVTKSATKADYQKATTTADESQHTMLLRLELTESMHDELIAHCRLRNIEFFSTAFDLESLEYLNSLGLPRVKVPSGEITNLPYLRKIGSFGKEVILSTGMSNMGEIEAAIDVLEKAGTLRDRIIVLHCNTEYPVPMHEVNVRAMPGPSRVHSGTLVSSIATSVSESKSAMAYGVMLSPARILFALQGLCLRIKAR